MKLISVVAHLFQYIFWYAGRTQTITIDDYVHQRHVQKASLKDIIEDVNF